MVTIILQITSENETNLLNLMKFYGIYVTDFYVINKVTDNSYSYQVKGNLFGFLQESEKDKEENLKSLVENFIRNQSITSLQFSR